MGNLHYRVPKYPEKHKNIHRFFPVSDFFIIFAVAFSRRKPQGLSGRV